MITKEEAYRIVQRVVFSYKQAPRSRFTMKFDSVDGVEEPFVVIVDTDRGQVRASGDMRPVNTVGMHLQQPKGTQ